MQMKRPMNQSNLVYRAKNPICVKDRRVPLRDPTRRIRGPPLQDAIVHRRVRRLRRRHHLHRLILGFIILHYLRSVLHLYLYLIFYLADRDLVHQGTEGGEGIRVRLLGAVVVATAGDELQRRLVEVAEATVNEIGAKQSVNDRSKSGE